MNDVNKLLESFDELKDNMSMAAGAAIPITRIEHEKGGYEVYLVAFRIPKNDSDKMASALIRCEIPEDYPDSDINFS